MILRTTGRQSEYQTGAASRFGLLHDDWPEFRVGPAWYLAGILVLAIASNGCHSLLIQGPNSDAMRGRLSGVRSTEPGNPDEVVLVDRTGQPVGAGVGSAATADQANIASEPLPAEQARQREGAERTAASSPPSESAPTPSPPPTQPAGTRTESVATAGRISAWSDFNLDLPLHTANPSPSPAPPEARAALPAVSPTAERASTVSNSGAPAQSFRVQVTEGQAGPTVGERQVWDAAQQAREEAKAAAMFQAVQQVTQQGMSRLSGTGSNANASPALANLLMEQVQGSLSEQQIQAANLALDNWETTETVPAFDLRGNRPLRQPAVDREELVGQQNALMAGGAAPNRDDRTQAYGPQGYRPATLGSSTQDGGPQTQPVGWTNADSTVDLRIPATDGTERERVDSEHWRPALQKAMVAVERAIPQAAHPQEQQSLEIYLRLLRLLAGDTDQAVGTIESLPKDRQAFWREQLFALSQIVQAPAPEQEAMLVNHSRQATKALAHLHNAMQALQNEATLQLRQVQFCQEIRSFGDYDRAKSTVVEAGDPLLIYCEVVNYRSERISDGNGEAFQTNLVPSYLIFDDRQRVVSQKEFAVVRDQCRSRRQDFYLVLQLEAPNLPRGKYHVQVSVEDVEGGKIAVSVPLSFQVR